MGRPTVIGLVSVNVALPEVVPGWSHRGHGVRSGMPKQPVATASLALSQLNLEGDGQADLSVHGGPDKAVYAYPSEHWPFFAAEIGAPFGPASFGENLSTSGALESDVCIGDRWRWGDAELEVCQPRTPCYKLALHTGTAQTGRLVRSTGFCGWYLRVLRTGTVPVAGPITVVPDPLGVTVADVTAAARSSDADAIVRVLGVPALAGEWRVPLRQALAS